MFLIQDQVATEVQQDHLQILQEGLQVAMPDTEQKMTTSLKIGNHILIHLQEADPQTKSSHRVKEILITTEVTVLM